MSDGRQKGSLTNVTQADIDSVKNQAHNDGRNRQEEKLNKKFEEGLNDFSQSLLEVLNDITALEVNTMIVDNITGTKFIAEEAYQNIYFCLNRYSNIVRDDDLRKYLKDEIAQLHDLKSFKGKDVRIPPQFTSLDNIDTYNKSVTPEVANGYKRLREKLVREYIQIFFDQIAFEEISESDQNEENKLPANLPFPYDIDTKRGYPKNLYFSEDLRIILDNSRFLRSLRKINELKAALDNGDLIYAQTVLQLDGDVINRYRRDLFEQKHKDLIISIHNEGVSGGEKQWRGLLKFAVDLVKDIMDSLRNVRRQN